MELSGILARVAVARPHLLLVEAPGALTVRAAVERAAAERGWTVAESPADADVLAVLGRPGETLGALAGHLYDQMPGPRALVHVAAPEDAPAALGVAVRHLADTEAQRLDAAERAGLPESPSEEHPTEEPDPDAEHGDMDHGDMDHGDMETAPHGIPLAGGADDRDGLEMDRLQVPLGPVLPGWPPGLVLRCALHGDVVMSATVDRLVPDAPVDPATPVVRAARHLGAAADVLQVAGWHSRSQRVRALRDACLDGDPTLADRVAHERDRIARSRLVRWTLGGLGTSVGGLRTRLLGLLDAVPGELAGTPPAWPVGEQLWGRLPDLVAGREVGEVRLVVAALGSALATEEEPARG